MFKARLIGYNRIEEQQRENLFFILWKYSERRDSKRVNTSFLLNWTAPCKDKTTNILAGSCPVHLRWVYATSL